MDLAAFNSLADPEPVHVYLVCASGRDADALLARPRARLGSDPATERAAALRELAAIDRLRLDRLVEA